MSRTGMLTHCFPGRGPSRATSCGRRNGRRARRSRVGQGPRASAGRARVRRTRSAQGCRVWLCGLRTRTTVEDHASGCVHQSVTGQPLRGLESGRRGFGRATGHCEFVVRTLHDARGGRRWLRVGTARRAAADAGLVATILENAREQGPIRTALSGRSVALIDRGPAASRKGHGRVVERAVIPDRCGRVVRRAGTNDRQVCFGTRADGAGLRGPPGTPIAHAYKAFASARRCTKAPVTGRRERTRRPWRRT